MNSPRTMAGPPGERPAALLEPWPQGKLLRHAGIGYEIVQSLDVPVPQTGEQLPNIVQFFSAQLPVVAEPVIEVPKILPHDVPLRRLCRVTQLAEQLVEVPTVLSYSSLQQLIVEQTVDMSISGRAEGGERGGLQGFSGQGSTASSSHVGAADGAGQDVFRTFPRWKKCGVGPHSGSELGADFTSWTPAAYAESMAIDDDECEVELESEVEVEEGAVTRFAAGFRPLRVCTRFLEAQWGGRGCANGDRCTFAHPWAELHPEASAHERELASYFPD